MDSETQKTVDKVMEAVALLDTHRDEAIKELQDQREEIDRKLLALGKGRIGRPPGAKKRSRKAGGKGVSSET